MLLHLLISTILVRLQVFFKKHEAVLESRKFLRCSDLATIWSQGSAYRPQTSVSGLAILATVQECLILTLTAAFHVVPL